MRFPMTTISLLALVGGVFLTATAELAHAQLSQPNHLTLPLILDIYDLQQDFGLQDGTA